MVFPMIPRLRRVAATIAIVPLHLFCTSAEASDSIKDSTSGSGPRGGGQAKTILHRDDGRTTVTIEPPEGADDAAGGASRATTGTDFPKPATVQPSVESLRDLVRQADAIPLHTLAARGPNIAAVRRRIEVLSTVRLMARGLLDGEDAPKRLEARLLAASAHENFANALDNLPPPPVTDPESLEAWEAQRTLYRDAARTRALAYLRSCASLGKSSRGTASAEFTRRCLSMLRDMTGRPGTGPGTGSLDQIPLTPAGIATARSGELSVCVSEAARRTLDTMPGQVLVRMEIGTDGTVSSAEVQGDEGSEGLKACLVDALKLWGFPGLEPMTLEIPLNLKVSQD